MEGIRKNPRRRFAVGLVFVSLLFLLICVTAVSGADQTLIWIAETRGVQTASQADGNILSEIPLAHEARAVAVDRQRNQVWVFSDKTVSAYGYDGTRKFATKIPPPPGEHAFLRIDPSDGSAWLAVQTQLYLLANTGTVLSKHRLPQPITDITLDRANSRLWVAYRNSIEIYDKSGNKHLRVDTQNASSIRALDYDQKLNQVWVVADDDLQRYSLEGMLAHELENSWFTDIARIAADQQGGLWASTARELTHIDQSGLVEFTLRAFDEPQSNMILDLVADSSDGSAWVASQRRIARFSRDSTRIVDFEPEAEDGKTRLIRRLALETPQLAPRIRITAPSDNSTLGNPRPVIELLIEGPEADPDSFVFMLNGGVFHFDCARQSESYSCVPSQAITDGMHLLIISVADVAGNRSQPAELHFTIDTIAPSIDITSPPEGLLTNQTTVQISGQVNETASLSINDTPKPVQQDGTFSHGPFTLNEGGNTFQLKATDTAGNIGERVLHVTRDTTPPPPAKADQIQAQQQSDGSVRITGAAGSVEGDITVTLVNMRTGERVTTAANPDGSFSATITGENGDEIQIFSTDRAGNTGQATSVVVKGDPFSGPINLTVVAPANGATISGDKALVVADLEAPLNTGLTVNGIPASGVPTSSGLRFYATAPLTVGQNVLTVTATTLDGREVTRTIEIGSTGPSAFSVTAEPAAGVAPQEAHFRIADQLGVGIQEVRYDFDNNGTQDLVTADPFETVSATFSGVGLRTISVSIVDASGTIRNQTANLVLLDPAQMDGVIRAIWDGMNSALIAGDKETAMRFLSATAKEKYGPVFDALMPRMPDIVDSYSTPQRSYLSTDMAEYGVNRSIDGTNRIFMIGFVTNDKGQWNVSEM